MTRDAIEIEGLGKRYRLGQDPSGYSTLREAIASRVSLSGGQPPREQELWALRDVDLVVPEGQVLGVVGANGAGKSTLLRVLARITEPTVGRARTRGRVGALLEVGTGFHPELTGRENVFLNGALLGVPRREIRRRLDDIVAFSGVERFIDTPMKRYSSGMRLRLAFAVAVEIRPTIIVVDEVLTVGDVEFQARCLGRMAEFGNEGRTVLYVSHDHGSITQLCDRVIWLDHGRLIADGGPREVVNAYLDSTVAARPLDGGQAAQATGARLKSAALVDRSGGELAAPTRGEPFTLRFTLDLAQELPGLELAIYLTDTRGVRVLDSATLDRPQDSNRLGPPGEYEVSVSIPPVLAVGEYLIGVWAGTSFEVVLEQPVTRFRVLPRPEDRAHLQRPTRLVHLDLEWSVRRSP